MRILHKLFSFWICTMLLGGILSFNNISAMIRLSEGITDDTAVVIKFDEKEDIKNFQDTLKKALTSLRMHRGSAMCPYDPFREILVRYFMDEVDKLVQQGAINFFAKQPGAVVNKMCNILADIILKGSKVSDCNGLKVITLNYIDLSQTAEESIVGVIGRACTLGAPEIRIVYDVEEGYKLVF